jgi:hypothetical protein
MQKREIVSNLAFLSATLDNSFKVIAICVKEHYNRKGITIQVVSNTRDLLAVTKGFVKLAKVLEYAA